ncbi:MAG TPA: PSD1 and planctomycete cytochrome C domain-containing protein, partial [Pirellulales bacterium]
MKADDADFVTALKRFEQTVAPALAAKCVSCHRPDNLKGGFDLTTREGMLKGGDAGSALTPCKPDETALYTRAVSTDGAKPEMPEKGEALTAEEAEALAAWVAAGAPWPEQFVIKEKAKADASFWSFLPLSKAAPPQAAAAPPAWQVNPVDRFIWTRLQEQGLEPNPPAEPRAFIRHATFDLTGLPPTPDEVASFVAECAAESAKDAHRSPLPDAAVARLVERLLASPHYGERWGRHWLDVIRFGESRGFERNEIITNIWPFRDYIIRSFNDDKPFDQLVREHLAGDVIGKDQPGVEIGSAFLVAGPYDDVGNQDPVAAAQIRSDQMDEMIRATSEAFLGLTVGCSRCHDHKFDPILTKDYYSLYSTFAGTVHGPREVATADARRERAAKLQPLQERRGKVAGEKEALEKELAERAQQAEAEMVKEWTRPRVSRYGTEELFEPIEAKFVRLTVEDTDASDPNRKHFKLDEFEVWTAGENPRNVALAVNGGKATGAAREAKDVAGLYGAAHTIDGAFGERFEASGRELMLEFPRIEKIQRVYFSSDRNKALDEDNVITTFVGDYQIEVSTDGQVWNRVANSSTRIPPNDRRKQARLKRRVEKPEDAARLETLSREIGELDREINAVPPLPVWWVGTHRAAPGPFNVFVGGNPQRRGDAVQPGSLSVLEPLASTYRLDEASDEGARRLALANWLIAADNPLTPRVLANRIWQYHFGTGIVDTPSDFGYMGGRPTHPELLDWLAGELLTNGWRIKPLHRLLMTSQAYRQSGDWRENAARADADSRLLWRFPPRRLSAEEVRDALLSVAGKLDLTPGGPGFRLYEYQQDNVATYVPLDVHGPATYRRAIYH